MTSAPRDGTRIIVVIRASEQGSSDVDVVRWAKPPSHGEYCWMSTESDQDCAIIYDDWEVANWMPLPSWSPPFRTPGLARRLPDPPEVDGSGI
ncbi:MAG TPA: hypothetical protein VKV77_04110 [Methylovirgula sp.]|nr:hypothetical protein [Methylovirgula sp.]